MSNIFKTSRRADTKQAVGNDHGSTAYVAADWLCLAAGDRRTSQSVQTQSAEDLERSFKALGIASRLRLLEPGVPTTIAASQAAV